MEADNIAYLYAPITKVDRKERLIEGIVNSGRADLVGQKVSMPWLKKVLPPWVADWGNMREMHVATKAVGRAQSVDLDAFPGPKLVSKCVDDDTWKKIEAGVYNGYSIGVKNPVIEKSVDPDAPNGEIVDGDLIEISYVDRPCDSLAKFTLLKSVGLGLWKDQQSGITLEVDQTAAATADVVKCTLDGCDCSCAPGAPDDDCDCQCAECVGIREDAAKIASPDFFKFVETGVYKRDFTPKQRKKLAGSGAAMKDGSYPIESTEDLKNAVSAFGRSKNPAATKAHIIRRAKALGATDLLPADWSGSTKIEEKTVTATATAPDTTESTQTVDSDLTKARAPKSEPSHAHPFKGAHNHTHDNMRGGTHTHAHLHDDDDMHDHPHLSGKDARLLSPEDRGAAMAMYAADPKSNPLTVDTTKGAPDFNVEQPAADLAGAKPKLIPAQTSTPIVDAVARLEALANQTDEDRDGDIDTPGPGTHPDKIEAPASFREVAPDPQSTMPTPSKLSLRFAADPDLVKALDLLIAERVDARLDAERAATLTKAAETMTTVAQVSSMSSDLAKGLGLIADRLEADAKKMVDHEARLGALAAELEKVSAMAAPVKGDGVVVEKTFLGQGSSPQRTLPEALRALALKHNLNDQEQLDLAAASYGRLTGQN